MTELCSPIIGYLIPPVNLLRELLDVDVVGSLLGAAVSWHGQVGVASQDSLGELLLYRL